MIDSKPSTKRANAVPIKNMIISPNLIRAAAAKPAKMSTNRSDSSNVIRLEANQNSVDA